MIVGRIYSCTVCRYPMRRSPAVPAFMCDRCGAVRREMEVLEDFADDEMVRWDGQVDRRAGTIQPNQNGGGEF
jgi:hypothetical protein